MTPKDLVGSAMRRQRPMRIPVMCQLANGHTIIQTGVHPIDYWIDNEVWADCLLQIRARYDFDGILVHKPARVRAILDQAERVDYDSETPTLYFPDGGRVECTRDDDTYYKGGDDFHFPAIEDLDPEDLLGWAPGSYVAFEQSKATIPISDPERLEDHHFAALDRVLKLAGANYSIHGEVRAPFDHLLSITGMEAGLMALLDAPDKAHQLLEVTTGWSVALAVAQARRGAAAIKVSSPFAGSGFLSPEMYREFILPYEARIASAVVPLGVPVYTHTCGAIGDRLDLMCAAGISGIECLDPPPLGDVELGAAVELLKDRIFIKGNVDPVNTLLRGDEATIRADVGAILDTGGSIPGFILSSACSVAPPTPPDHLKLMVELCHAHVMK